MKLIFSVLFILITCSLLGQTPGIIVRPAGTAGPVVLDPDANGYSSILTSGFGSSDITNSEIPYKIVLPVTSEPTGDLLRGPSGSFSDIVRTFDGSGFYMFANATNLFFRLRIGGIVSGSKGYSALLDTDQKFGNSGPDADPNFQAATNGNNGNPGFEYEVVFESNFRIAIYNADGTSTPTLIASYPLATNSMVSVAATRDGGNPDYFYDFYVPFAAMGLTSASTIRSIATTVMSPQGAIGGPKSDIYGLSGNSYMNDWITGITMQPPFTISQITSVGTGIGASCTAPPVVDQNITPTSANITGTWTKSSYSAETSATIYLYRGTTLVNTTSVLSGGTWTIPVSGLVNGEKITAKAQAPNESLCNSSNEVRVNSCTATTHTTTPGITCSSDRGFAGTRASGAAIKLYKLTSAGYVLLADDATTTYRIGYPTATTWRYDDVNPQSSSACTGGPVDIDDGSYFITADLSPNCTSLPLEICIGSLAATAAPVITSALADGVSSISGTATANASVLLFINDYYAQSTTATATGTFTLNLTNKLSLNESIKLRSVATGNCVSSSVTGTVSCYIAAPIIIADATNRVTAAKQLNGTSSAAVGTTIIIYNAATLLSVGSATVLTNGTWTMASPNIVAGTTYHAKVTGSACGTSLASNTVTGTAGTAPARCGTITGTINDAANSVSGKVTTAVAGTIVTLYADGESVGSVTTASVDWTIPVNTTVFNKIYAGAELTIDVTETGKTSVTCGATNVVACVSPTAPSITPTFSTIAVGQSVTYTIANSQTGILYTLRDDTDASEAGSSVFGNGASVNNTTNVFTTQGTYTIRVKAISFSGDNCTSYSNATVNVTEALPLSLLNFYGSYDGGKANLVWQTVFEQDIIDFEVERSTPTNNFKSIGSVTAVGNSQVTNQYNFVDAAVPSGIVYYRLKIKDNSFAGFKYSKIIVFHTEKGIIVNQIAPNPFTDNIQLSCNTIKKTEMSVTLKDMAGRLVKIMTYSAKKGINKISIEGLQKLSAGTYVIELLADGQRIHSEVLLKR
ncbi:MAG: T9SS type A sorting domain-containing protein [Ferruginibacter sp.]